MAERRRRVPVKRATGEAARVLPCVAGILLVCAPAPLRALQVGGARATEEVRFRNGDLALAGLWFKPEGTGPFPTAVLIRGSGPSTRDSYWARAIKDVLLDAGVAVLLPDKRGSDGSSGDWRTADFQALAGDAVAAVRFARMRPGVRRDAVGLVGLSQGGKVAPVAAAAAEEVAFVVDLSGAATTFVEQVSWEMYHTLREAGLNGESLQEALILQVTAESYVQGHVDWASYRRLLDEALGGDWAGAAGGFPSEVDAWQWSFFRSVSHFDPLPWWTEVEQPVLVVYGEEDGNAPAVRSAYRLTRAFMEAGHTDWTLRVLPGTGHGLWDPRGGDPHRPALHPELVELLPAWLRRVTRP